MRHTVIMSLISILSFTSCGKIDLMGLQIPDTSQGTAPGLGLNIGFGGGEPIRTQIQEVRAVADCPELQVGLAWVMDRESYSACFGI